MRITFGIVEKWEEKAVANSHDFLEKILTLEQSAQAKAIAAQFPSGSAIDLSCIKITEEGLSVLQNIDAKLSTANAHITAIKSGIVSQLANTQTENKKGFLHFLTLAGAYLRAIAAGI